MRLVSPYGMQVKQAALRPRRWTAKKLPYFEKVADDMLYGLFAPYRYETASIEVLIAYLLQKQREAADVRLILTGKTQRLPA